MWCDNMKCIHVFRDSGDRLVLVSWGLKFWVSVDHMCYYMEVFVLGLYSGAFNSSGYIILNDEATASRWTGNGLDGGGPGLNEVRSRTPSEGIRENHDTSRSGQPVPGPRYEPRTARIRSRNATHSTFPAFYATRRYITMFTRSRNWFFSCSTQTLPDYLTFWCSSLTCAYTRVKEEMHTLISLPLPPRNLHCTSQFPHAKYKLTVSTRW